MPGSPMEFAAYQEAFALGLSQVYKNTLEAHERSYTAFLREEPAKRWFDTDWLVSGLGSMPTKGIGASITTDRILKSPTKQYPLTAYALGCVIEYEAMQWDLYGVFDGLPEGLARSATDRYNIVGHSVLNNAFSAPTTDYNLYNGSDTICQVSHTRLDGGTWSNQDSTNIGCSFLGLVAAKISLAKVVDERGIFVKLSPKLIVTSEDQRWIAETLLGSDTRPDNANRAKNVARTGISGNYASPYITSTQNWFVFADKADVKIKLRLGESPRLTRDSDVRNMNLVMTSYCSFGIAVFDSRGVWGSTGGG